MTVLLIILAAVIGISVAFFAMKKGMIEDKDGNNIPDVIDVKIEEGKFMLIKLFLLTSNVDV